MSFIFFYVFIYFIIFLLYNFLGFTHSRQRVWEQAPPHVFVRHQPRYRPAQWLLHIHEDSSHHAHTIVFVVIGRPVRLPLLRPVLPDQPTALAHGRSRESTDARRRGYGVSWSCSWSFSVRATEEDTMAPATLRLSWRWGVQV
jgi:hypothetical protein